MTRTEALFGLGVLIVFIGLIISIKISPDPFGIYSKYPTIEAIDQTRFEVGEDKHIIEKVLGEGYESGTLSNDGIWSARVVYKRIVNRKVQLVRFYYSNEKLTSISFE